MKDRPDLTDQFNTALPPDQERKFQAWLKEAARSRDLADYDLRGAWAANAKAAANGHLPDTWKKPNHPTFSTESVYNGKDGAIGGRWIDLGKGKWAFEPSATNIANMGVDGLQDYFRRVEPDSTLKLDRSQILYPKDQPK